MGEAIRIGREHERAANALRAMFRDATASVRGTFEQREAAALALANELMRSWVADELHAIEHALEDEVTVGGERYRRGSEGTVRYHTLCGAVAVRRAIYRRVGVHNGPTVVPLELAAGLQENATPALAFSVTQAFASGPLRDYQLAMAAAHREVPSRSTLERIGKRIGTAIDATIDETEPLIRAGEPLLDGVCSISVGLDRTTVPMSEPIPNAEPPPPRIRRRPPPATVAYRMAYVGTVSLHDADGRVCATKRFGASANDGPARLVERIAAEVRHQRARYDVPISAIQDGAPELWRLLDDMCARHDITLAERVIDRYHVDEHLADVCEHATGSAAVAAELYEAWRDQLDSSDTAIERIIRHLDALVAHSMFGTAEGDPPPSFWFERGIADLGGDALSSVSKHLEYFRRYRRQIRYASRRRHGLPIGSGPTEGACKSLVTIRFKRSGQRWFESGVVPCLSLRALHLSDRLRPAFDRYTGTRTASMAAA